MLIPEVAKSSCDLLSNSYLCSICDSNSPCTSSTRAVVICFQILTFAVSATAKCITIRAKIRCDLLSNSYLCSICDSLQDTFAYQRAVVICFQILTFAVSATARWQQRSHFPQLWFAFKFLPLQYLRQPCEFLSGSYHRCDLLSNSYLCSICDSASGFQCNPEVVVICFQILTFAVSATAEANHNVPAKPLWFAFKFLPLQYLRQP